MKFISRLNQRLGEKIRNNVVRDIENGRFSGPNKVGAAARFIAILIVSTPYVLGSIGLAGAVFGFPDIPLLVIGVLLIASAIFLRPRAIRNHAPTLRDTDAPALLGLLNRIAEELDAPAIDGVHVTGDFNAYIVEFNSRERIVGIGAPLWLALDHRERLALLAHEVAHLANNDPARGRLTGVAMMTLSRWFDLFSPSLVDNEYNAEVIDERGFLAQLWGGLFGGVVDAIALAYEKLIFVESQRAEYLADILAASVAGAPAVQSVFRKTILEPLAGDFVPRCYYDGSRELRLFEGMADAVATPDADAAERLFAEAAETLHSVDSTHPPTRYRIDVIGAVDQGCGTLQAALIDWNSIDDEISVPISEEEKHTLSLMMVQ